MADIGSDGAMLAATPDPFSPSGSIIIAP